MTADASIYQMLHQQKPQPGPLDNYSQMMSVKQLMGSNELQDLQRQQLMKNMSDESATEAAYREAGGDFVKARELLYGRGLYKQGISADKANLDARTAQANLEKTQGEIRAKRMTEFRDGLSDVTTPAQAVEYKKAQFADPVLGPVLKANGKTLEGSLAEIPSDPAAFQAYIQKNALGMTKYIEMNKPNVHVQNTGGASNVVAVPGLGGAPQTLSSTPMTATPGETLTDARTREQGTLNRNVTMRGQNMTDARAAESRDIHAAQVDPMGILGINKRPSAAAVAGSGVSGAEYLATLPPGVAQQVKAIAEGKLQISPRTLQSPQGAALIQMAMQYEPGTDQTIYQSRAATAKDAASGKLATSNNALNTVTGHMAGLMDAAEKLDNTRFPWVNKVKNAALSAGGDPRVKEFDLNMQGVANELERAYRGAGGSEADIKLWRESLGNSSSPEQFKGVMAKGAEMLQSKLEANHAQYVQGMHGKPGDYQSITPKTVQALNRLRGVKAEATASSGGWSVVK